MTVQIIRGDALHLPLADESVDLVCTSPPYFALRSYTDGCRSCNGTGKAQAPDSYRVKTCSGCGETTSRVKCHNGCGVPMKWTKPEAAEIGEACLECSGTGRGHYPGQIGSEATPQEWLEALWQATAEMVRVLKPGGSIFVNLGDKYDSSTRHTSQPFLANSDEYRAGRVEARRPVFGRAKSLMLLPERYRIGAIDRLGLIARAVIIWDKPNGLPESVTDRVRRSHEDWVHLTKQPRYYAAVDEIREPHNDRNRPNGWMGNDGIAARAAPPTKDGVARQTFDPTYREYNPLGKLPGSVWTIPTEPLTVPPELGVDHFAAYPTEWPRRIIQGWTPPGICQECGQGRRPVAAATADYLYVLEQTGKTVETRRREPSASEWQAITEFIRDYRIKAGLSRQQVSEAVVGTPSGACWWWENSAQIRPPTLENWRNLKKVLNLPDTWDSLLLDTYMRPAGNLITGDVPISGRHRTAGTVGLHSSRTITGYVCACPPGRSGPQAPTRPAVVLDPFMGTGTTLLAAHVLGRHAIGVDLSADYCRLARWRVNDPDQRARAARVDKPPPVIDGQLTLDGMS